MPKMPIGYVKAALHEHSKQIKEIREKAAGRMEMIETDLKNLHIDYVQADKEQNDENKMDIAKKIEARKAQKQSCQLDLDRINLISDLIDACLESIKDV